MQKIRFIVNSSCQQNCIFCHKENVLYKNSHNLLNSEDYAFLAQTMYEMGIKSFVLTGGEPLLREDIIDIIQAITSTKCALQITTNGILLNKVQNIKGLDHINVSLHTLDQEKFKQITNTNTNPNEILNNIKEFKKHNNAKIKINMVALKDFTFNDSNLESMLGVCKKLNISLKIIELLDHKSSLYIPYNKILERLINMNYKIISNYRGGQVLKNGTSQVIIQKCFCNYIKDNELSAEYCIKNNDMFVTPNGDINYCRQQKSIPAYDIIKKRDKDSLKELIKNINRLTRKC